MFQQWEDFHFVRLMASTQPSNSCRSLFEQLEILRVPCQYIHSLLNFIIYYQKNFQTNSSIRNINTRNKHHLRSQNGNLSCLQKSAFCAGIKLFNSLPPGVTILRNDKAKFKVGFTKYLHTHFFYSVDEFCVWRWFMTSNT